MPKDYFLELVRTRVAPVAKPWEEGIQVRGGRTLPFIVERGWSGPGGHYIERWSIRREAAEVMYQSEPKQVFVRSMQAVTTHTDQVDEPIALEPGNYQLVFIVEGRYMGSAPIRVYESETAAA